MAPLSSVGRRRERFHNRFRRNEEGPMTKTEVDRFRAVLTTTVAELARTRNRDGITVERSADQLDEIQAASQCALAVCSLDREFNHIRDARAALRRIQKGNFGICQEGEEELHPKRLSAGPWGT